MTTPIKDGNPPSHIPAIPTPSTPAALSDNKKIAAAYESQKLQRKPLTHAELITLPLEDISFEIGQKYKTNAQWSRINRSYMAFFEDKRSKLKQLYGAPDCTFRGEFVYSVYSFEVNGKQIIVFTAKGKGTGYEAVDKSPETIAAGLKVAQMIS